MTEPIYRRTRHNGDEQDAFSRRARRVVASLQRAGVVHATKTRAARRTRRETAAALRGARAVAPAMFAAGRALDMAGILATYDELQAV